MFQHRFLFQTKFQSATMESALAGVSIVLASPPSRRNTLHIIRIAKFFRDHVADTDDITHVVTSIGMPAPHAGEGDKFRGRRPGNFIACKVLIKKQLLPIHGADDALETGAFRFHAKPICENLNVDAVMINGRSVKREEEGEALPWSTGLKGRQRASRDTTEVDACFYGKQLQRDSTKAFQKCHRAWLRRENT